MSWTVTMLGLPGVVIGDDRDGRVAVQILNAANRGGGEPGGGEPGDVAWGDIDGDIADQADLAAALDGKAPATHGHAISAVDGLQAALNGKANTSHTQPISTVTGLSAALNAITETLETIDGVLEGLGSAAGEDVDAFDTAGTAAEEVSEHAGETDGVHGISVFGATVIAAADAATARGLLDAAASSHNHAASQITSGTLSRDRMPTVRGSKTIVVPEPVVGDRIGFYTRRAMTLQQISAVLVGSSSPSVTWSLRYAADRSAAGTAVVTAGTTTTTTTTAQAVTTFNQAVIPANSHVWLEISAVSGVVDQIEVTPDYEEAA